MAIINAYTQTEEGWLHDVVDYDGFAWQYITENSNGNNFQVYNGELCRSNEVSRDENIMRRLEDCTVFFTPGVSAAALIAVAVVSAAAVVLLTPKPKALDNVNRQQESPNNSLSRRNNEARINQRIVDICGKVKSIPDVMQPEWARYEDNVEVRTGAYCVARKQVLIEELKDTDTTFEDANQSAGIYYPFKSPNNSAPDVQIGDPINEPVVGVFESSNALDQTLTARNESVIGLLGTGVTIFPTGTIQANAGFSEILSAGDVGTLRDVKVGANLIGETDMPVISSTSNEIVFDITNDPSWAVIPPGGSSLNTSGGVDPRVEKVSETVIGPFTISSIKIDRFIANVYAPSGMYKEDSTGKRSTSVVFRLVYQKLNDNLDPIGPETPVDATISGADPNLKGQTIDVSLGGLTFLKWSLQRITEKDYGFNGTVVDDIKIRSIFGLYGIDRDEFGDITMIQTQRKAIAETLLIKDPEVNCIATELVNKYENGSFSPALTPNTQAFQSLIRLALDDKIGRRQESELDLDLLVDVQQDIEDYFQNAEAGSFNYSFDSTDTTAQETFFTIANAAFSIVWREGRVLKAWFERPQSLPSMVFTHRSKVPDSETWTRNFSNNERKDSVELVYTDDQLYTQETFYIPEDRSGTNPERIEIPGIKGISQATWRAYREFNKIKYSDITVDFTSTAEGRFVKPSRIISVVKGTRVGTYDGYVMAIDGRVLTLSQDVVFTPGDDHSIILKRRDGSVESIGVSDVGEKRKVELDFLPSEPVYVGNDEQKTEFSFGNEARLLGQWIIPQEINPSEKSQVQISGINYADEYYQQDPVQPVKGGFSNGFSNGFANQE